jgi:hypothetical protein
MVAEDQRVIRTLHTVTNIFYRGALSIDKGKGIPYPTGRNDEVLLHVADADDRVFNYFASNVLLTSGGSGTGSKNDIEEMWARKQDELFAKIPAADKPAQALWWNAQIADLQNKLLGSFGSNAPQLSTYVMSGDDAASAAADDDAAAAKVKELEARLDEVREDIYAFVARINSARQAWDSVSKGFVREQRAAAAKVFNSVRPKFDDVKEGDSIAEKIEAIGSLSTILGDVVAEIRSTLGPFGKGDAKAKIARVMAILKE